MNHFIPKCANYIFQKHSIAELAHVCVVLPTRRGVFFFKEALANEATKPFISPKILAVEDFILEATNLKLLEPVDLLFGLFTAYKSVETDAKFEHFMSWAPTLLKDFEGIDQYLVDTKQLFSYMTAAEAIKRWAITDWKNSNTSTSVSKYFELFKVLHQVYLTFNQALKEKGKVYRGSAYKHLAENIDTILIEKPSFKKYYFLGFNALSNSEQKIIKALVDAKLAETLWDTDQYYMVNANGQQAGLFLKAIKKEALFGPIWNWQTDDLIKNSKNIKIIGLPNASQQPKVASHYLEKWFENKPENTSTAVILADETLLPALITQLPESVGDYNITMGVSLKHSPIYSLIVSVFELHQSQKNVLHNQKLQFNTRLIIKILNHQYIKNWCQKQNISLQPVLQKIKSENDLFISDLQLKKHFPNDKLTESVFTHWQENPQNAVKSLFSLVEILEQVFDENQNSIEQEYLAHFYKILNRLQVIVENNLLNINILSLKQLLFELIKQEKIPFEGQPINQLQIMGMLETRTLDFDRIIITSLNETVLPSGKKSTSLIPFDGMQVNGMPTYGHQDAIMAYHFFRILQKAKEVILIYTLPKSLYGGNEKSRFIIQIEQELAKLNKNISLEYPNIKYKSNRPERPDSNLEVFKSDEIIEKIKQELQTKGLFATHMNSYVSCSMQYYLGRIAKIYVPDEIDNHIGADKFGSWIHKTLENISKEIMKKGEIISSEPLASMLINLDIRLKKEFANIYGNISLDSGMNLILLNIAEKILTGHFENEIETGQYPQEILALEKLLIVSTSIKIGEEIIEIKVAGKIDKIDIQGNNLRVIDYKTGKVEEKNINFKDKLTYEEKEFKLLTDKRLDKLRQLWLYRYLVLKSIHTTNGLAIGEKNIHPNQYDVEPGIYSFRNNKAGFMKGIKSFDQEDYSDKNFIATSEKIIGKFIEELLDSSKPFQLTADLQTCQFCGYKGICNR